MTLNCSPTDMLGSRVESRLEALGGRVSVGPVSKAGGRDVSPLRHGRSDAVAAWPKAARPGGLIRHLLCYPWLIRHLLCCHPLTCYLRCRRLPHHRPKLSSTLINNDTKDFKLKNGQTRKIDRCLKYYKSSKFVQSKFFVLSPSLSPPLFSVASFRFRAEAG